MVLRIGTASFGYLERVLGVCAVVIPFAACVDFNNVVVVSCLN